MPNAPICVALSGASGAPYGLKLLKSLVAAGQEIYCMISKAGLLVVNSETELTLSSKPQAIAAELTVYTNAEPGQIQVFGLEQWSAPVASGTGRCGGMVICPCSMGMIARVAAGMSSNVLERAADVMIKENRKLILVPRETPYSALHLKNMLQLAQVGAVILDANPAFYHKPQSMEELIDFVVARILDQLGIEHKLGPRWGEEKSE